MRAPAVLRSVVTGCKSSKLGSNDDHPNDIHTFILMIFLVSWYPMNTKNGMCILELKVYMNTQFHCCFMKKRFAILVVAFNNPLWECDVVHSMLGLLLAQY